MNEIKPLTSKDGRSEWMVGSIIVIATPARTGCIGCELRFTTDCALMENYSNLPHCIEDFNKSIIYIEKPKK